MNILPFPRFLLKSRSFAAWLLAASAVMAHAQPVAPKPPVVFTAMAWDLTIPEGGLALNFKAEGRERTIELYGRERSLEQACDRVGELVFSQKVERDGKLINVPMATASMPEGIVRALLVFGRNPSREPDSPPYLVKVIDDSYALFPGQTVRFINLSRLRLGGTLGAQPFEVMAGQDKVIPASLPEADRLLPFKLARWDAGGWRRLRSTGLPMSAGLRVLVFLTDDPSRPDNPKLVLLCDKVEPVTMLPPGSLARNSSLRVNLNAR